MKNKKVSRILFFFISIILCGGMVATSAFAVLPPKYYEKAAEDSKIKATAIVKSVKVTEHYNAVDEKVVTFELIKSFGPEKAPKTFTGRCKSVNKRWFERGPGAGGDIYYYPGKGEKVYVTMHNDGSHITSFTRLTPELDKSLNENFKKVKTKMGSAYVSK